jgi:hypothetical protein
VNDKAADTKDVPLGCAVVPADHPRGFSAARRNPEREKTDATSPIDVEGRKTGPSAYAAAYGLIRMK